MKNMKIPEVAVSRLSVYSRFLTQIEKSGVSRISSGEIAAGTGGTPAQVRKDLAYFGEFGTRGVGYNVAELNKEICNILGIGKKWRVILIGAGNLGSALTQYAGFKSRGFEIEAVFDNDLNKVGLRLNGTPVMAINRIYDYVVENKIDIAIIAVPEKNAQDIADLLVTSGIKGILNFAPVSLNIPENVQVRNVDLAVNLEILSFNMVINEKE